MGAKQSQIITRFKPFDWQLLTSEFDLLLFTGDPVTVGVTLYILSIGDLSEKFMDFTFDMYFRQFWSDNRLRFNGSNFNIDKLVVGAEYIRLIWVPDTFFVNEKVATFHKATTENQFLRISQSGDVLRSIRWCSFYFFFILSMFWSVGCVGWERAVHSMNSSFVSVKNICEMFQVDNQGDLQHEPGQFPYGWSVMYSRNWKLWLHHGRPEVQIFQNILFMA